MVKQGNVPNVQSVHSVHSVQGLVQATLMHKKDKILSELYREVAPIQLDLNGDNGLNPLKVTWRETLRAESKGKIHAIHIRIYIECRMSLSIEVGVIHLIVAALIEGVS
jgi:hypothetical protein